MEKSTRELDRNEISIDVDNFNLEDELKLFEDYTPRPTEIAIRLYIRPAETKSKIILPPKIVEKDIYNEITGYVAKIGKCAFTGERYKEWGEWYKVGDWVVFPRHSGVRFTYDGLPVFSIVDDAPLAVISDPRRVE